MNAAGQFVGQQRIQGPMPCQQPLTIELLADHHQLEVGFRSRRHPVHIAFVNHFKMHGRQRRLYLAFDDTLYRHEELLSK